MTDDLLAHNGHLAQVLGLHVGHFTHPDRPTGCSVVLCPQGATAGVDVRGAAPGTRETDALAPENLVDAVDALAYLLERHFDSDRRRDDLCSGRFGT